MGGGPNPCAALSRLYSPPRETLREEGGKGKQDPLGAHGNQPVGGLAPRPVAPHLLGEYTREKATQGG